MLPIANLKRETIICTTHSLFQNKLSEVLYEDSGMVSKGLSFADETKSVIDALNEQEKRIFQEVTRSKNFLTVSSYLLINMNF